MVTSETELKHVTFFRSTEFDMNSRSIENNLFSDVTNHVLGQKREQYMA